MGISIGALSVAPTLRLHSESVTAKPYGVEIHRAPHPRVRFSAAGAVGGLRRTGSRVLEISKGTRRCARSLASRVEALAESAAPKPKVEGEAGGGTDVLIFCGVGGVDGLRLGSRVEGKLSVGI